MHNPRLIASYLTLAGNIIPFASDAPSPLPLAERAAVAAQAGYVGMGIDMFDLAHDVRTYGYDGIRSILSDNGLNYLELEVLTDWFTEGDRRTVSDGTRALMLKAAAELGAYQIKVLGELLAEPGSGAPDPVSVERLGEEFGILCRQAAASGTRVGIELVPCFSIADLDTGRRVVEIGGEANGGLVLDIWHIVRGGIAYEDIATLPAELILGVELNDASNIQIGSIIEDTINNRLLPGEGDFDVPKFLQAIAKAGYSGGYGVEIVSNAHRARNLSDAATLPFAATMEQFAIANGHPA